MAHTVFLTVHAACATVAWLAGLVALPAGRLFGVHRAATVGMAAALPPTVASGWSGYDAGARVAFCALTVLAVVMVVRTWLAGGVRPVAGSGPAAAYVDHLGFTLISLTDGFAVVAVLRAGAPVWAAVAVGVVVVVVGVWAVGAVKERLVRSPSGAVRR